MVGRRKKKSSKLACVCSLLACECSHDPWTQEMAYHALSFLILEILSQFNEWCKIGTYVSLFCKSFIIL